MLSTLGYLSTIIVLYLLYGMSVLSSENLFLALNSLFSLFVCIKLYSIRMKPLLFISPIFLASVFMFLLSYGFPVLAEYFDGSIRYGVRYESMNIALLYVSLAFIVMWHSYHSKYLNKLMGKLLIFSGLFRKEMNLNLPIIYVVIAFSVISNLFSIYNGNYGVLSTIYTSHDDIGVADQLVYFLSLGLKGCVFLLAWQYYKYRKNKFLFFFSFSLLLFFQLLAGFKGGIIQTFLILFIANYIVYRRINYSLFFVSIVSISLAYAIVNPYREYLILAKEHPASIVDIIICISNGVMLQSVVANETDVNLLLEIFSRFTTLPELAAFVEYKEQFGLIVGRDPNFVSLCLTIPFQLLIPRFFWPTKPINDLGVWWVSNTVVGNMSNSSTAFGPVGFLYLTAGAFAVIFGFFIVAFILKIGDSLINMQRDGAVLVGIIFLTCIYGMEMNFNVYIVTAVRFLFVAYIFQLIIINRIQWK